MSKSLKMANSQQQNVKPLDVSINICNYADKVECVVSLYNPEKSAKLHEETFKLLPNVPLETYVQYTFGMYNALICKNENENA